MLNYYGDTLARGSEELDKYFARIDHGNTVLEHFKNMLSIIGKEMDYDSLGIIVEGQAEVAQDRLEVSTATNAYYVGEAAKWKAQMEAAQASGDTAAFELYKKNWEAAEEKARES
jgi:hypothetical protein